MLCNYSNYWLCCAHDPWKIKGYVLSCIQELTQRHLRRQIMATKVCDQQHALSNARCASATESRVGDWQLGIVACKCLSSSKCCWAGSDHWVASSTSCCCMVQPTAADAQKQQKAVQCMQVHRYRYLHTSITQSWDISCCGAQLLLKHICCCRCTRSVASEPSSPPVSCDVQLVIITHVWHQQRVCCLSTACVTSEPLPCTGMQ